MRPALHVALASALFLGCARRPSASALHTTDPIVAASNLSAQIDAQERLVGRTPASIDALGALVELLQERARFFGSVDDLAEAERLAERTLSAPRDARALLIRASTRASLHRFEEALDELGRAEALGAEPVRARALRASILQGQGNHAAALHLRRQAAAEWANTTNLGSLAAAELAAGDLAAAAQHFDAAEAAYGDVSPFPLAWISFERGLLAERRGDPEAAKVDYRAALSRLPQYAQARAHLAAVFALLGERTRAEELLEPLVNAADPEYAGQLAALRGDRELRTRAARRYEALLAEYPQAFAEHAARFYLPFDSARALRLARLNLTVRRTPEAYDLALSSALVAGEIDCSLAAEARAAVKTTRIAALSDRLCTAARRGN